MPTDQRSHQLPTRQSIFNRLLAPLSRRRGSAEPEGPPTRQRRGSSPDTSQHGRSSSYRTRRLFSAEIDPRVALQAAPPQQRRRNSAPAVVLEVQAAAAIKGANASPSLTADDLAKEKDDGGAEYTLLEAHSFTNSASSSLSASCSSLPSVQSVRDAAPSPPPAEPRCAASTTTAASETSAAQHEATTTVRARRASGESSVQVAAREGRLDLARASAAWHQGGHSLRPLM